MPEIAPHHAHSPSKLVICDRLITLAQEADRAGCADTARHLVDLLDTVFPEPPRRLRQPRRLAS
jgi:hypothetical protein